MAPKDARAERNLNTELMDCDMHISARIMFKGTLRSLVAAGSSQKLYMSLIFSSIGRCYQRDGKLSIGERRQM
ncbi:MAG: hypothetical protein C4560_13930 [Nitrospiraceae bacterium]|nr:MAG: hypothetical protein C4560_13930 [Nitrospiraceae bacterium]